MSHDIMVYNGYPQKSRRCHIILRPHPKNRPRLSRDNKIDDI